MLAGILVEAEVVEVLGEKGEVRLEDGGGGGGERWGDRNGDRKGTGERWGDRKGDREGKREKKELCPQHHSMEVCGHWH